MITVLVNYGPFLKGDRYKPAGRGYDWFLLKSRGQLIYINDKFVDVSGRSAINKDDDEEFDFLNVEELTQK